MTDRLPKYVRVLSARTNEVCYVHGDWALYPSKFDNNRAVAGAALDFTSDELQPSDALSW